MAEQNKYLRPQDIQLFLLDRGASDNFLLDDREFQDDQLNMAIELTVDRYNTTSPFINFQTVADFPFRIELLYGVTAILLKMKAINMIRNRVNYSTQGGVTVDEKKSAEDYLALADRFDKEFESRVGKIKAWININEGYGGMATVYTSINLGAGAFAN